MDVEPSTVSRVLSGVRRPGTEFMRKVEAAMGWTWKDQHMALGDGEYPERFRRQIKQWRPPRS